MFRFVLTFRVGCAALLMAAVASPSLAQTTPPLEAYGALPQIRQAAMSPDGRKIAMAMEVDGEARLAVFDLDGGAPKAIGTGEAQVRGLSFAGNDHVILQASDALRPRGFRGQIEYSGAFAVNLEKMEVQRLLQGNTKGLYPAQTGLGRIVGFNETGTMAYMPGWYAEYRGAQPEYHLFRVNLETGRGVIMHHGSGDTRDWFVTPAGDILAREDFSNRHEAYKVITNVGKRNTTILEERDVERPPYSLMAVKAGNEALIVSYLDNNEAFQQVRELSFDGKISAPLFQRDDADVDRFFMDQNQILHGVQFSGPVPNYEFFDKDLNGDIAAIVAGSPNDAVHLIGWSDDWQHLLLKIEGSSSAGMYLYYDRVSKAKIKVGDARPDIPRETIGEVLSFSYAARDGQEITAIATFPPGADLATAANLPLVALPHGGPATYDAVRFDWMAQYFASRGYLVLQPNFRGSAGHGLKFLQAGDGEWGAKMQDDVTDGVNMLIEDGLANPDRVCIVGASYGGYAALAGGAFTPDLYKCVVAIAPVSDLNMMLDQVKNDRGNDHWATNYWLEKIADGEASRAALRTVSPAKHAEAFTAPVLLLHGENDTVVSMRHSEAMHGALKRAGKSVSLVKLDGEDHWLSQSATRLQTLRAMGTFVDTHIGE